jgi:hypothetical protein
MCEEVHCGAYQSETYPRSIDIDCSGLRSCRTSLDICSIYHDEHESRFELTETFIRNEWRHPIRALQVIPEGTGPVHLAPDDCEVHIGSRFQDDSISDYPRLVLEPPSVCKDTSKSKTAWRKFYEGATEKN